MKLKDFGSFVKIIEAIYIYCEDFEFMILSGFAWCVISISRLFHV